MMPYMPNGIENEVLEAPPAGDGDMVLQLKWLKMASECPSTVRTPRMKGLITQMCRGPSFINPSLVIEL